MAAHAVKKTEVFLDQAVKADKIKAENADKPPLFIYLAANYTVDGIKALLAHVNADVAEGLKLSTRGKKDVLVSRLFDYCMNAEFHFITFEDQLNFIQLLCEGTDIDYVESDLKESKLCVAHEYERTVDSLAQSKGGADGFWDRDFSNLHAK